MAYDPFLSAAPDGVKLVIGNLGETVSCGCYGRSAVRGNRGLLSGIDRQLQNHAWLLSSVGHGVSILMP